MDGAFRVFGVTAAGDASCDSGSDAGVSDGSTTGGFSDRRLRLTLSLAPGGRPRLLKGGGGTKAVPVSVLGLLFFGAAMGVPELNGVARCDMDATPKCCSGTVTVGRNGKWCSPRSRFGGCNIELMLAAWRGQRSAQTKTRPGTSNPALENRPSMESPPCDW